MSQPRGRTALPPAHIADLIRCAAVFLPDDPPRSSRVAFWRPDGHAPVEPARSALLDGAGSWEDLSVVLPSGNGNVARHLAHSDPLFTAIAPQRASHLREWANEVSVGNEAEVRLSLRIEVSGLTDAAEAVERDQVRFRAVPQLHSRDDPTLVADVTDAWSESSPAAARFGSPPTAPYGETRTCSPHLLISPHRLHGAWSSRTRHNT